MIAYLPKSFVGACAVCAVLFSTGPVLAQGDKPEITIMGRGNGPIRVFIDGVEVPSATRRAYSIVQSKRATASAVSEEEASVDGEETDEAAGGESGESAEGSADSQSNAAPPAVPASAEEVAPARAELLRQILQDELSRSAVPSFPPDGLGRSLDRGGEAGSAARPVRRYGGARGLDRGGEELLVGSTGRPVRRYGGARGLDRGGEAGLDRGGETVSGSGDISLPAGVELTDEETRILQEARAQLRSQSWEGAGASSEEMTDEQRQLRQQLNQEMINQVIPAMSASAQKRNQRSSSDRVDRGRNPADIKVPIPEHLLQQPAPRIPDRSPRGFRDRTESTSKSKRKN